MVRSSISLKNPYFLFAFFALSISAFWLRWLYISGDVGLFIDEYYSLWNGIRTWQAGVPLMLTGVLETRGIVHSYLLVPAIAWGELTPLFSRFTSLVLGIGALFVMWTVGRSGWNERVAWIATVGLAFLPEAIEASGRIRFYAPLMILTLLTLWAAFRVLYRRDQLQAPFFFALSFGLTLFAMDEIVLLYPFILLGWLLWHGWRFFLTPQRLGAIGFTLLAGGIRLALEIGASPGYTDLIGAEKQYFTLDFQLFKAWDTYDQLLIEGIRLPISLFALLAVGISVWKLVQQRGRVNRLPRFDQATLFFALQFVGVFGVLLFLAGWREARYLWFVQPIWLLLGIAGCVRLMETRITGFTRRWIVAMILSGVLIMGLWRSTWQTIQAQPEGFTQAFDYVADHLQPGDVVISPQPHICAIILQRPCDYYGRERGYEDFVILQNGNWRDIWTNAPLLDTAEGLEQVIQRHPRVWFISDGHSFGERYREAYFRVLVDQISFITDFRGVRVLRADGFQRPLPYQMSHRYDPGVDIGPYRLLGWERSDAVAGQPLYLLLDWQQTQFSTDQINTSIHLVAADTSRITQSDGPPAKGIIATIDDTRAHLPDPKPLELPADLPDGRYRLELIAYDSATEVPLQPALPIAWFRLGDPPSVPALPVPIQWAEGLTLFGTDTIPDTLEPNGTLPIQVGWYTKQPLSRDYTGFVHLIGPDGTLIAQSDRAPENGFYPTTAWESDDPVVEVHTLPLPDTLPAGTYHLYVGWYHLESGERLPLQDGTDAFELHRWQAK